MSIKLCLRQIFFLNETETMTMTLSDIHWSNGRIHNTWKLTHKYLKAFCLSIIYFVVVRKEWSNHNSKGNSYLQTVYRAEISNNAYYEFKYASTTYNVRYYNFVLKK